MYSRRKPAVRSLFLRSPSCQIWRRSTYNFRAVSPPLPPASLQIHCCIRNGGKGADFPSRAPWTCEMQWPPYIARQSEYPPMPNAGKYPKGTGGTRAMLHPLFPAASGGRPGAPFVGHSLPCRSSAAARYSLHSPKCRWPSGCRGWPSFHLLLLPGPRWCAATGKPGMPCYSYRCSHRYIFGP